MKKIIIFLVTLNAFHSLHALVDMNNANYSNTWIDAKISGIGGYDLKISRTYNSHSLRQGLFGYGWCSDFETKIEITPEGNPRLKECGDGSETVFYPREFDLQQIKKTITAIVAEQKKTKKLDEKYFINFGEELLEKHDLRGQYARDLKIGIPIKEGTRFYANGKGIESIVLSNRIYVRTLADGSTQSFNDRGLLMQMNDKNGNYIKMDRDNEDVLASITDNQGRRFQFKYYPNKKVKSINGPFGIFVEYKYENMDDLSWVKNQWTNVYTYKYDESHNLVQAIYPDKTNIVLTYDQKNDWVTSFKDREGCLENYVYEFSKENPKLHYWSFVKKVCQGKVVNDSKHEFWYQKRNDGQIYLARTASITNGSLTDISYHETFGRPVSITKNSLKNDFEYYPNGLVKAKISKFIRQYFEYSKETNKLIKVTTDTHNEVGKKVSSKYSFFSYNKGGLLTSAGNSDGQTIQIEHDQRGRMTLLKDQAKKVVLIDYDADSDKPKSIKRPGLGAISIRYSSKGELIPDIKEDPSVAMQVASTFNNFLDIILPASAEVYQ